MKDKKVIGVIPARYQSSRLPGKPLKDIYGKPMIYWVAKQVEKSNLKEYYVATDDDRIFDACQKYSIPCVMTSTECINGTERVAELAAKIKADYYVNIQGDEPCIEIDVINTFIESSQEFKQIDFIQAISKITDTESAADKSIVKVATTKDNKILYYSRLPIPYAIEGEAEATHYKSLGLYLYSKSFLHSYSLMGSAELENTEHIEQLRILENGISIYAVEVNDNGISVDTEEDLARIKSEFRDHFQ